MQYLGWGVAATATPLVMLLAGGTFFWTSVLARVGGAAANLAAAGATAGAVTQVEICVTFHPTSSLPLCRRPALSVVSEPQHKLSPDAFTGTKQVAVECFSLLSLECNP